MSIQTAVPHGPSGAGCEAEIAQAAGALLVQLRRMSDQVEARYCGAGRVDGDVLDPDREIEEAFTATIALAHRANYGPLAESLVQVQRSRGGSFVVIAPDPSLNPVCDSVSVLIDAAKTIAACRSEVVGIAGKSKRKQAGRKPPSEQEIQEDLALKTEWDMAKAAGKTKEQFCSDKSIKQNVLDKCLDRIRKRIERTNRAN